MDFITAIQKLGRLHKDSLMGFFYFWPVHLSSVTYCVFAMNKRLFSLADPKAKFIGYLFKLLFVNCLIIRSVRNMDVSLDPGLNFGDHMHNVFEDLFLLFWNITYLGEGGVGFVLVWVFGVFFDILSILHCSFEFQFTKMQWY